LHGRSSEEEPVKQPGPNDETIDELNGPSTLFSYATWNIQGKHYSAADVVLHDFQADFNVVSFQEVTVPGCSVEQGDYVVDADPMKEWTEIHAHPTACFRLLSCRVDGEMSVSEIVVGHSHFSFVFSLPVFVKPVVWVNAHLPHVSRPLADLQDALTSLQSQLIDDLCRRMLSYCHRG
jgi:hypothetical protein